MRTVRINILRLSALSCIKGLSLDRGVDLHYLCVRFINCMEMMIVNRSHHSLRFVLALLCLGASIVCRAEIGAAAVSAMKTRIEERIARVDARVGVAVVFDGSDTLTVKGFEAFPKSE